LASTHEINQNIMRLPLVSGQPRRTTAQNSARNSFTQSKSAFERNWLWTAATRRRFQSADMSAHPKFHPQPSTFNPQPNLGNASRTPQLEEYTAAQAGQTATYWLRWVSTRGDKGPWSEPVSATIPG
jgi:hypothetical protein